LSIFPNISNSPIIRAERIVKVKIIMVY
jgi:hypothetical protein